MFYHLLYELVLWIIAVAAFPLFIFRLVFKGKYRKSFLKRFGNRSKFTKSQNSYVIWVHAVSVGETKAVAGLVKMVRARFPKAHIICSCVTETGHAEGKRMMPFADEHLYLPFDFSWNVRSVLKKVRPDLVIFCETDFWYNFLRIAKEYGSTNILVNGKISDKSLKRFLSISHFATELLSQFDLILVQNKLYFDRFLQLGVPEEKMKTTGNLKFDEVYPYLTPQDVLEWKLRLGITPNDCVFVIGSTHAPEEKLILEQLQVVWTSVPNLKVILVPRHPERFNEVHQILVANNIPTIRFSTIENRTGQEKVILIDAMGKLRSCYQIADLAFVAGSYVEKIGGHNILEPLFYGVPVLFGPYMANQPDMVSLVKEYQCGKEVTIDEFSSAAVTLLTDIEEKKLFGERGLRLVGSIKGALERTWATIIEKVTIPRDSGCDK